MVPACGETERSVTKGKEKKEGRPAEPGWAARTTGKPPRPAAERPAPHSPWPRPTRNAQRRAERAEAAARRKARHGTTAAVKHIAARHDSCRKAGRGCRVLRGGKPLCSLGELVPVCLSASDGTDLWFGSVLCTSILAPSRRSFFRSVLLSRHIAADSARFAPAGPPRAATCAPTWTRFGIPLLKIAAK